MRRIIYTLLGLLCSSCASDLHFELPPGPVGPTGPPGANGKSAYELWVEAVHERTVEWSGTTALDDFFRYLKGRDGKDGTDGLSAYELWQEQVAAGIDDPHNPGRHWDRSKTTLVHFFQYLTGPAGRDGVNGRDGTNGADGLSAYELWVDLLEIPGAIEWDGGTTLLDFFRYLKGKDGANGANGLNGLPGSNGVNGDNGADGLSAYELWVADVEAGTIVWGGTTTYADFWEYLKGEPGNDGNDGNDGLNGVNGLSAYELWLLEIIEGTVVWNGEFTLDGFWEYLKGEPGQNGASAYALWVQLVAEGISDPHTPGANWPADRITIIDFYAYLTGSIGLQGLPGETGPPGEQGPQGPPGEDGAMSFLQFMEVMIESYYMWVADVEAGVTPVTWPAGKNSFDKFLEYCMDDNSYLILPQP